MHHNSRMARKWGKNRTHSMSARERRTAKIQRMKELAMQQRRKPESAARPILPVVYEANANMMDENNNTPNVAPPMAPALVIPEKKKWANMTNEEKEEHRKRKIKQIKAKAAKQKRRTAKAQATRASRLANEAARAAAERADKEAKSRKTRANRERRAAKYAALKDEFAARVEAAKAKRASGNSAGANAMVDEIRADIRKRFNNENNENKGETGLEAFFNNLGI